MSALFPCCDGGAGGGCSAMAFSSLFRDIHSPRDLLPELAAERHHNRELVLLTTNWAQLDLALNLVAQLEALGLHHHVLFGDNARLVEHVRRHGPPGASMVWSSLLERYTQPLGPDPRCPRSCGDGDEGPADTFAMNRASLPPPPNRSAAATACHAAQRAHCLPSAASFYRCDSVRRLWLLRHHYTAQLLNMRYNVLLLDSDSMVLADPYPLVRRHLQGYTALCLHDITARPLMTVNGGTWYVRGASPEGPVQRVFASAFERALQVRSCVCARTSHTHTHMHMHMHMFTCFTCACTISHAHAHAHAHVNTLCTCTCTCACACACACACHVHVACA